MPLYILLEGTLNGIHTSIVLYRNLYIRKKQINIRCSTISIFLGFEKHLIIESGGLSKLEERNRLYKDHPKGFYVYAKSKSDNNDFNNGKNIQGCINYFIRYVGRPAMAENRITEYNKESKTVSWFYNDHKDEKRYDVTDNVIDSFNRDPIQCKCGAIMQYTYTYNPFKDKRNDRTYRKRCIDEMMRMYKRRI